MPAVASAHDVRAWRAAEVAVLLGVEAPVREVAVDPRRGVEVMVEAEASGVLHLAAVAVPDAGLELRRIEVGLHEILQQKVPVAARQHVVHRARRHRLVGKRRHMVAHENVASTRCGRPMFAYPLPVALYDGRLRLHHHHVGTALAEAALELLGRPFLGDAIKPKNLVARLLQHRRSRCWHDGEDVGGPREPLELPVLRKERYALLAGQRRIADGDLHV